MIQLLSFCRGVPLKKSFDSELVIAQALIADLFVEVIGHRHAIDILVAIDEIGSCDRVGSDFHDDLSLEFG